MAQDWFRARKLRISDVFRQQDRNCKGVVTKKQFVESMIASSKFCQLSDLVRYLMHFSIEKQFYINLF